LFGVDIIINKIIIYFPDLYIILISALQVTLTGQYLFESFPCNHDFHFVSTVAIINFPPGTTYMSELYIYDCFLLLLFLSRFLTTFVFIRSRFFASNGCVSHTVFTPTHCCLPWKKSEFILIRYATIVLSVLPTAVLFVVVFFFSTIALSSSSSSFLL